MRLARILRDYDDAGGLNELISLWGFVDDHVFLTKAGHVGLVVRGYAASTTKGLPTSSDRPWCTRSKRDCGCSTSGAASTSTSSSVRWIRSSRRHAACRWPTRPFSVGRHT